MFPPFLPGSRPSSDDSEPITGLSGGRFSQQQLLMLNELIIWWSYRRIADDSLDPFTSLIGGVDLSGTCRTSGLTPTPISFTLPITPVPAGGPYGSAAFVQALGIPDPPSVGEVYSILALCHFYFHPSHGWHTRSTVTTRAPAAETSTSVSVGVDLISNIPYISMTGVSGLSIDWLVNVSRCEL